MISEFQGDYRPFSNFWFLKTGVVLFDSEAFGDENGNVVYPTTEHAYQAAKTLDVKIRREISKLAKPGDAKRAGKNLVLRPDWESVKLRIMLDINKQKYFQSDLKRLLLSTGNQELIEGNRWHDNYWGICFCDRCQNHIVPVGCNWLGKILMHIRFELSLNKE